MMHPLKRTARSRAAFGVHDSVPGTNDRVLIGGNIASDSSSLSKRRMPVRWARKDKPDL
jgi:hypothetical protein